MASIKIKNLCKEFNGISVVKNINLKIKDGEFITLLGPSGCGKTTTLRMIAGLEEPTGGEIYIDNNIMFSPIKKINVPPEKRNIGMVFQNYAVWPHMTVFENISYPLKNKGIPKSEIKEKVLKILKVVKLNGHENKYPHQLSGGQQQRVALARALVTEPKVLLLDEPLSNLDAKLRESMRFEIKELQRKFNITVIYVTHDQSEAMAMSDRVVVMKDGEIQQVGKPLEIYNNPANRFVAEFIGLANFIKVDEVKDGNVILFDGKVVINYNNPLKNNGKFLMVRPFDIEIFKDPVKNSICGVIKRATFLGDYVEYLIDVDSYEIKARSLTDTFYKEGDKVYIKIKRGVLIG